MSIVLILIILVLSGMIINQNIDYMEMHPLKKNLDDTFTSYTDTDKITKKIHRL